MENSEVYKEVQKMVGELKADLDTYFERELVLKKLLLLLFNELKGQDELIKSLPEAVVVLLGLIKFELYDTEGLDFT